MSLADARPLDVHVRVHRFHAYAGHVRIANYLVAHNLLTPEQAACATLIRGPNGSRRVQHIGVFERSGGACPGAPQPPAHLFDVFVDTVSGVVDTTKSDPDELQTVL